MGLQLGLSPYQVGQCYWRELMLVADINAADARRREGSSGNLLAADPADMAKAMTL